MDRKQIFNLENSDDIAYLLSYLDEIDDEMAVNSDIGGDDDSEDEAGLVTPSTSSSISLRSSDQFRRDTETDPNLNNISHTGPRNPFSEESSSNEDSENQDGIANIAWSSNGYVPHKYRTFEFQKPFGLSNNVEIGTNNPLICFQLYFGYTLLQHIVVQSNLYATQHHQQLDLTLEELKALLGLLIIMGFHKLPSLRLYWSNDINFAVSRVFSIMPLKRFLKILRFIHLNDNSVMPKKGEAGYDRLYKIRPVIDTLNTSFRAAYNLSRNLSIDESMVKFKGRSTLKQYMPQKPIKRGFKMWVVACAETGYCLGMSLYQGKDGDAREYSLGEKVVTTFAAPYENLGYCLYFDNFFSSIEMMKRLLQKQFFSCATIRQTRKDFPKHALRPDKSLKKGESDGAMSGEISVCKWKDRSTKSVCVASTIHNALKKVTVLRTNKQGCREAVNCPVPIADYNKYMGGVDHFDQLHATYNISWKSRRWWLKIFYYLLDAAIVNSYIRYKLTTKQTSITKKPKTHLQFRCDLASQLINNYVSRTKKGPAVVTGRGRKRNNPDGRATIPNSVRLVNVGEHLPVKGNTFRRCTQCSTTKYQKRSRTLCSGCNVALCIECFVQFHKS